MKLTKGNDYRKNAKDTLGVRNNNPLNLRPSYKKGEVEQWQGMTGVNSGFMVFSNTIFGLRAAAIDIMGDIKKGKDTLAKLINEFAPKSENNTASYIRSVSELTGIGMNDILKPDFDTLVKIIYAKLRIENGQSIYKFISIYDVKTGVYYALNRSKKFSPNDPKTISETGAGTLGIVLVFLLVITYKLFK